ncbi:centrosome and spindle pole-associated protein 1 isoform X4 [Clinocottus analis]|uniref:centrosome and spindle pole-associated protein 1 isoform X4 n=1 Tax=Clinocottus analis TaxID=304258 RepID=UPI0035C11625
MPPASAAHRIAPIPDRGFDLSSLLGNDYERKKKKLQQELQLEYKHYATKIKNLKTTEPPTQPLGLSLPIEEKKFLQEKLREERKKEYNLFLQEKSQIERFKRGTPPLTSKPGQVEASDAVYISSPASPLPFLNTHTNIHPPPREHPASRRDAATLTEAVDNGESTGTGGPGHRSRRRWQLPKPKELYTSEEEPITDKEEELEFSTRRRQDEQTLEPEYKEERRTRERRAHRAPQGITKMEAPGVRDQNNNEWVWKSEEQPATRRDAATLTESVNNGESTGTGCSGHRSQRHRQLHLPKELYSSEEEPITAKEEELEFRTRRRQDRQTLEPECKEERRYIISLVVVVCLYGRAPQGITKVEAPGVHGQNNSECDLKSDLRMPDSLRTAARSRPASKDIAEFATGLMIGAAEEQTASQMKKEKYKQELLEQIAEQQRNKIREKKLRVASTGDTNMEKQQFGAINRQYGSWRRDVSQEDTEQRGPAGKSHVDYSTALSQLTEKAAPGSGRRAAHDVPPLEYYDEDYRDSSSMLAGVANPRVAGVPSLVPPTINNNYNTPYDAAYNYYGTRNPLDLNLPYSQNLPGGMYQSGDFYSHPQRPSTLRPTGHTEGPSLQDNCVSAPSLSAYRANEQYSASPLDGGELPADKSQRRREKALIYQQALRQQIKEKEERKRREKDEKEQYDAKLEAEMIAYNPWGRSGGGASIKDEQGNLVSDLTQMHKTNEESYRNPVSRKNGQTQSFSTTNGPNPVTEGKPPLSHPLPGLNDKPTPQQLHTQDRYKEDLKQQIEDNKQKQTEEIERVRVEEEKEEKRLADQRACIQQEYEKEQRKQKEMQNMKEKTGLIQESKTQHQKEEKRARREEEHGKKEPESARDREEKKPYWIYEQREPSPPIPTLQRRQTTLVASRPSSVESQLTASTERSVSAPHSRPVPGEISPLQDGQQEVIKELSTLRKYLRNEQRQLEVQLGQTDLQESHYTPPNRPRGRHRGAFESMHQQADQPATRRPSSGAAGVNMQNIREFNHLKYRDTASREEVRHMYPDPPTDGQSLDIQQQALLRDQQRKIRLMKREKEHGVLEQQLSHHRSRNKPGRYIHRDSILPSEAAFIDFYSGDACEGQVQQRRHRQPSAEQHERTTSRRRHDCDEEAVSMDQWDSNNQPDAQSLQSVTSSHLESKVRDHNQHRITREDPGDHNDRSERPSSDEVDVSSLRSALERRVSMETVATEAWLRPGTSDTVNRAGCTTRPNSGMDAPPRLTH